MVPWLGIDEETFLQWAGYIMIGSGLVTFVASQATRAPYGRYSHEAGNMYGPPVPARLAWMLQECPSVFVPLICLLFGNLPPPPILASNLDLDSLLLAQEARQAWQGS